MIGESFSVFPVDLKAAIIRHPLVVSADTSPMEAVQQMYGSHPTQVSPTRSALTPQQPQQAETLSVATSVILVVENRQVLGILTERDIVNLISQGSSLESQDIRQVMTQPVIMVQESELTDLFSTLNLLKEHHIQHLPVLDEHNNLSGLITFESLWQRVGPLERLRLRLADEIMNRKVACASPDFPVLAIAQRMATQKLSAIVIVDSSHGADSGPTAAISPPLGIVTERDLVKFQAIRQNSKQTTAKDIMGQPLLTVRPETSLWEIQQLMEKHGIRRVVVTHESGALLGMVTQADLLQALNPLERYNLAEVLEQRVLRLEAQNTQLLQERTAQLELQATTHQQLQAELSLRKQAEEQLRESEERYRILYDQAVVGFASLDFNGQFRDVNTSFCKLLGYSREELLLKNPSDITHPENRASIHEQLADLFSGKIPKISQEKRYIRKDGSCFWAQLEMSLAREKSGQPAYTLAVIQDISDRKQAELALQNLISGTAKTTGKDFFPALVKYIGQALEVDYVLVSELIENELQVLAYYHNGILQPTFSFPLANTPCEQVCNTGRLYIENCVQDEFPKHLDLVKMQAESYLGIALENADGQATGNLCILSKNPLQDLQRTEQILQVFAARASVELARQRTKNKLEDLNNSLEMKVHLRTEELKSRENTIRQHAVREKLLRVISQRIRRSLDLEIIFNTACYEVRKVLRADRVSIFQVHLGSDQGSGEFVSESVAKGVKSLLNQHVREDIFCEKYSELYAQGRFFTTSDIYVDILSDCHREMLAELQIRATLVMPLLCEGSLWGLFCIHQCEAPRNWQKHDIEFAKQLVNQLTIAIQQANLFEQLQQELSERQQVQNALAERNQQLAITNEELARATRLKDEFLANMSHELRTPLNAILGMSECLKDKLLGEISEKQKNALETIHSSGSHLLLLINEILDLSKIQAGQIKLELQPVSVDFLCDSSLIFVKQQALRKQIQLSTDLPDNLSHLFILDQRRILQCLINLLTNAVKFTAQGGSVTLAVRDTEADVSLGQNHPASGLPEESAPQHLLEFSVTDSGIGIAPENIDKLFQPFIQVDSALNRKYDGTGLGLALVKRIVELHGGNISLESSLGQGSTFKFQIPCSVVSNTSALPILMHNHEIPKLPAEKDNPDRPLILLAEDNEAGINLFQTFLSSKGYRLEIARNGIEAISLAQTQQPDLILMDIQMPEMDGLEAMRQIRLDPQLAKVPIIALTALAMTGDHERCVAAGANDYLSKPVKLMQLVKTIDRLLVPSSPS